MRVSSFISEKDGLDGLEELTLGRAGRNLWQTQYTEVTTDRQLERDPTGLLPTSGTDCKEPAEGEVHWHWRHVDTVASFVTPEKPFTFFEHM